MNDDINKGYYAVIPACVRYDNRLSANEKLLYGEITSLSNSQGYCWASNSYFADLYNTTIRTIQTWISNLIRLGYIEKDLIYKPDSKEVERRYLKISPGVVKKTSWGGEENFTGGGEENFTDNNNNILINKNNIKKDISKDISKESAKVDYQQVIDLFHEICTSLPTLRIVTDKRKKAIVNRLKKYSLDDLRNAFENVEKSDFLTGKKGNWKADFDWLFKNDENIAKVLEGSYNNNNRADYNFNLRTGPALSGEWAAGVGK